MAERTDIPTEEEMDQMKLSKLTRLLQKLGMTEDETDEMDKDEARAELKKRVRAIQATAATSRRPGQAAEKMKDIVEMHKLKRTRLAVLCRNIFGYHCKLDKRTMKMVKTQMEREAGDILEGVKTQLGKDECPILVAGETSSGKSTFLNLLLGEGDILPVAHMSSTSTICELKYGKTRQAVVHMREQGHKIIIPLDGTEESQAELKSYMHLEGDCRDSLPPAERVEVFWPLPLLEGGIVIVDSPGVGESDVMDKVVADYIPKCFAFLYIIDSSRAGGVQTDRLGRLLQHYTKKKHAEDFNPESAMFICNKWDTVPAKEEEKLKEDTWRKLSGLWHGLTKSQLFFTSTKKAVVMGGILSEDFTKVLDGIDILLPKSLENKLKTQHKLLVRLLNTALDHVDGQINVAHQNLDKEEKQKRFQVAQKNLKSFRQEADDKVEEMESLTNSNVWDRKDFLYHLDTEKLKKEIDMRKLRKRLEEFQSKFSEGKKLQDILDMLVDERRRSSSYSSESDELLALYDVLTANLADVSSFQKHVTSMEEWFLQKMHSVARSLVRSYRQAMSASMGTCRQDTDMKVNDVLSAKLSNKGPSFVQSVGSVLASGFESLSNLFFVSAASKEMVDFVTEAISSDNISTGLTHNQLKSQQSLFGDLKHDVTKMKRVMEQTIEDAFQDTRSNEELLQIYEPQSRDINGLLGHLTMFYLTEVQKYQYSLDSIGGWTDKKNRLGGGSLGKVYRVPLRTASHTHAALKTGDLISHETACDFMREESTLRKLQGKHIVEYYGTACRKEGGGLRLGLVMELCEGTLESRIVSDHNRDHNPAWWGSNPRQQAAAFSYTQNLAVQLCEGLKHIHDAGYIHRDLKLTSILVTKKNRVKLAVGLTEREVKITGTMVGNPIYAAPEMKEQKAYNKSADIYSLGLILWEMWYGRTLFDEEDEEYYKSMEEDLKRGWDISMPGWQDTVPPIPEWTSLIHDCLRKEPTRRPQIQECLDRISAMKIK